MTSAKGLAKRNCTDRNEKVVPPRHRSRRMAYSPRTNIDQTTSAKSLQTVIASMLRSTEDGRSMTIVKSACRRRVMEQVLSYFHMPFTSLIYTCLFEHSCEAFSCTIFFLFKDCTRFLRVHGVAQSLLPEDSQYPRVR